MWETWVWSLGWEDPLEKEMATHTSILAWRIPWMEEPGGLQSMGLQSQTRLSDFTSLHFSQSCNFSSSHVRMWELDHKEGCCSVAQSCLTVYKPMDLTMTVGFPVLHHLLELAQTYVHWVIMGALWCNHNVNDAIQPCYPLSPPSLTLNLSQDQGHFQWDSSSYQMA